MDDDVTPIKDWRKRLRTAKALRNFLEQCLQEYRYTHPEANSEKVLRAIADTVMDQHKLIQTTDLEKRLAKVEAELRRKRLEVVK